MAEIDTKRCPYCAEEIRAEAIKCRHCGSRLGTGGRLSRPWHRSHRDRMIAGVAAGLAEELGISVTVVRLAFVLAVVLGWGLGLVLYIVLWLIMPYRPGDETPSLDDGPRG